MTATVHIQMRSKIDPTFWWRGCPIISKKSLKKEIRDAKKVFGDTWEMSVVEISMIETKKIDE